MPVLYLLAPNEDDIPEELPDDVDPEIGEQKAYSKQNDALTKARELRQMGVGSTIYKAETAKMGSRDLMAALFNHDEDAFESLEEFKTFEGVE